mgnify:CR=1 FL=1
MHILDWLITFVPLGLIVATYMPSEPHLEILPK